MKFEDWTIWDVILNVGWLIIWVAVGTYVLWIHNTLLPYLFLVYALVMHVANRYLVCTRCYYYGKKCYLLGGICAKVFPQRRLGPQTPDDAIVAVTWLVLTVFPIPFLIYYRDWTSVIVFSLIAFGWHIAHKFFGCAKCKNNWCPLNSKKGA